MLFVGLAAAVGSGSYLAGQANAAGIPSGDPLHYGGILEEDGALIQGNRDITVSLWSGVDTIDEDERLCTADFPDTAFAEGRFRVALPTECLDAVRENTEIWGEIALSGTPLGRAKVGAVPFAMSVEYAESVDVATTVERARLNFDVSESLTVDGEVSAPNGTARFGRTTIDEAGSGPSTALTVAQFGPGWSGAVGVGKVSAIQFDFGDLTVPIIQTENLDVGTANRLSLRSGIGNYAPIPTLNIAGPTNFGGLGNGARLHITGSLSWNSTGPYETVDYTDAGGAKCTDGSFMVGVNHDNSFPPTCAPFGTGRRIESIICGRPR
jgi:hypothetical protein